MGKLIGSEPTAKQWKGLQLVGVFLLVLGILLVLVAAGHESPRRIYGAAGVPILGVGIAVYGWVMAWWSRG